ncbi:CinA family protein [Paractinoplanes brasiliensis]|uniref:CinA family protein n=1 Tax=Paractinoplanes brasiliensis TaxID=52695 RepID=UPI00106174AB|nr:CinA family protein [Actinoplanes brasiliensis]GID25856.1 competence protein [Actinoplanes brasiliensis]
MGSEIAASVAVRRLRERDETFATVESLTGGLVASTVVEIEGVSKVYKGGLVVYATELKHVLAGVPESLLAERGPVDPDVAKALAEGTRARCDTTWAVATTGVAGPEPQDGKPVGLVYVAVAGPGVAEVRELNLDGDRDAIRTESVTRALLLLAECLKDAPAVV